MNIQWFPGHMAKAVRLIEENLKLVDVVGYVLDSRAPAACFNPVFDTLVGNKGVVFILNKRDMADDVVLEKWKEFFVGKGAKAVAVNAAKGDNVNAILQSFEGMKKTRVERFAGKGVFTPTRAMIIGVPNCGKSTVINALAGRKTAITGDKPGVTKGKQWVRLGKEIELLDTPGTLWGKIEEEKTAKHLAYIGSVKDDVLDITTLAFSFLEEISSIYPQRLVERYKIRNITDKGDELLKEVCVSRGYLLRGGEFDYDRGAAAVIDDFRKGRLGKICLEKP